MWQLQKLNSVLQPKLTLANNDQPVMILTVVTDCLHACNKNYMTLLIWVFWLDEL